jgi:hypothetical protein
VPDRFTPPPASSASGALTSLLVVITILTAISISISISTMSRMQKIAALVEQQVIVSVRSSSPSLFQHPQSKITMLMI